MDKLWSGFERLEKGDGQVTKSNENCLLKKSLFETAWKKSSWTYYWFKWKTGRKNVISCFQDLGHCIYKVMNSVNFKLRRWLLESYDDKNHIHGEEDIFLLEAKEWVDNLTFVRHLYRTLSYSNCLNDNGTHLFYKIR